MEAGQHFSDLLAALLRRGDDDIGWHEGARGGGYGGGVGVFGEKKLNRIESADSAEQFLRPADVHRGGADVGQRGGIVGFEDKADTEVGGASVGIHAQDVALL